MRRRRAVLLAAVAALAAALGSASTAARTDSVSPILEVTAGATTWPEAPLPSTTPTPFTAPLLTPTLTPTPTQRALDGPLPADLRVEIPKLGIDLPLAVGDVTRDTPGAAYAGATPENVALLHPASAPLASGGNSYVYAHARTGMFLSLWSAQVGDQVTIRSAATAVVLRYTVTRVIPRVPPSDTSWLDPAGPERLTLQTSTGPLPSDPRFIVVAMRDP